MKNDSGALSFIDLDTPNQNNDRISSIATIVTKKEKIISEEYYLVNPESKLDQNKTNTILAMLLSRPKFPEVWESIKYYFTNGIVAAYDADAVLAVLYRTLSHYKINIPDIYYISVMDTAKAMYRRARTLFELCREYGIKYEMNNDAFENALICGQLFFKLQKKFKFRTEDLIQRYVPPETLLSKGLDSMVARAVNELGGIIQGISSDDYISETEIKAFADWMDEYRDCVHETQIKDISHIIERFITNKKVAVEDLDKLGAFIYRFQLKRSSGRDSTGAMQTLRGIIHGLTADTVINDEEILALEKWMTQHQYLSGNYTFSRLEDKLNGILKGGKITQKEKDEIYKTLSSIV